MRPIKLVMSAFGPYKDRIEVDFEKLGSEGIFLITGDTGSGKTTIFDAICFALYGEASGSKRENGTFRSDFAKDNMKTYVELEFEHKEILYKIERTPRYFRKKLRGEGMTTVGGDAVLSYLDQVVTGDKNVTDRCVEILGISASQFKQIAMIAQGEFLELLLAKSKDRANIFRRIFGTEIYKDISDRLKVEYLNKKREYEDVMLSLDGYKESIMWKTEVSEDLDFSDLLQLLERDIENDKLDEAVLLKEKNEIDKKLVCVVQRITEGTIINDSFDMLEKNNLLLKELLDREQDIIKKKEIVQKNRDIWEKIVPKYRELEKIRHSILEKEKDLEKNQELSNEVCFDYDKVNSKFQSLDNYMERLEKLKKESQEWKDKLSRLGEIKDLENKLLYQNFLRDVLLIRDRNIILEKFCDKKKLDIELQNLKKNLVDSKKSYLEKNQNYMKDYDLFLSLQAGLLASTLEDNCPCPVCGSLVHPNLAPYDEGALSKEKLDLERQEVEELYQGLETLRLNIQDKELKLDVLNQELHTISEEKIMLEICELEKKIQGYRDHFELVDEGEEIPLKDVEFEIHRLEVQLSEFRDSLGDDFTEDSVLLKIQNVDKEIYEIELEISKIKELYEVHLKEKIRIQSFIQVLEKDLGKLHDDEKIVDKEYMDSYLMLGYESEEEYLKVQLDIEEVDQFDNEIKNYYDELGQFRSKIGTLEEIVLGKERVDVLKLEKEKCQINERLNSLNLSLKDISHKLSNNIKVFDKIKSVYEKSTKLEHILMVYKDLSDTANGTITGKRRLDFEQFVQTSYFDRVIDSANKRLSYMTDERYQLCRKEESVKISDKLGLELEVLDYYTGKKRDIKSLSGGESFKAALSLALGMSDIIQSYSGGVVVDAMFIDEGFGSLDEESLEQAMNAIMMLSQNNRMIGIISHVSELKDRIDKKIIVRKSSSGSNVEIMI